ncbi:hypothetical protein [Streptomyces sp. NPDC001450]
MACDHVGANQRVDLAGWVAFQAAHYLALSLPLGGASLQVGAGALDRAGTEEIEGALALMDTMTVDALEGPGFVDHYTEALEQVIEAKR